MAILLVILSRIWPYLLGAALLTGGWLYADRVCWSTACRHERASADTLRAEKVAAQERATAIALLWSKAIQNVEVRYVEVERKRQDAFGGIRDGAGRIRPATDSVRVRVPAGALRLLGDIAIAANDSPAPSVDQRPAAPVPESARDTTLTEWIAFAADAGEAYREARDKHLACVNAYESLRSTFPLVHD